MHSHAITSIAQAQHNIDALVHWDDKCWMPHSIISNIHNTMKAVQPLTLLNKHLHQERPRVQNIISQHLVKERAEAAISKFFRTRLTKWLADESQVEPAAAHIRQVLREACKQLPCYVVAAYLKTVGNAWCTASRFGESAKCPLGCGMAAGSKAQHLLNCPELKAVATKLLHNSWKGWPVQGGIESALCCSCHEFGIRANIVQVCWHDLALQAFNARRKGSTSSVLSLIKGRIRAICRSHPPAKALLRAAFRGEMIAA